MLCLCWPISQSQISQIFHQNFSAYVSSSFRTFHPGRIFTSSFQDCFFCPKSLLSRNTSFRPQAISFPNIDSLYAETQHMIILLIVGSSSCSFINCTIQDVHFCLFQVLLKFVCNLYWLQLRTIRLLLKGSTVQFQSFTHTHPQHVLSISSCSLSYFFTYKVHLIRFKVISISHKLISCREKIKFYHIYEMKRILLKRKKTSVVMK